NPNKGNTSECKPGSKHAFVVHGLWPQFETGMGPMSCSQVPLDADSKKLGAEIFADPGLVQHEWGKHGTCTGLSPHDYFTSVSTAANTIKVPDKYKSLSSPLQASPQDIVKDFAATNSAPATAFRVTCRSGELQELDACFDKDLHLRACGKVN